MLALGFDLMNPLIELFGFEGMRLQSLLCFRCLLLQPGIEFIDMPRQAVDLAGAFVQGMYLLRRLMLQIVTLGPHLFDDLIQVFTSA